MSDFLAGYPRRGYPLQRQIVATLPATVDDHTKAVRAALRDADQFTDGHFSFPVQDTGSMTRNDHHRTSYFLSTLPQHHDFRDNIGNCGNVNIYVSR